MAQLHFDSKEHSLITELGAKGVQKLNSKKAFSHWKTVQKDKLIRTTHISNGDNYIFKGENLITLHSIKSVFLGKVKLIYIDPPYNTKRALFGYKDNFGHEEWLRMMKNRLEIAKSFLRPDGVIFISIGIQEMAYLKVLCDEIFGRTNFIGEIIWETASDNNARQITVQHEYILSYAKDRTQQEPWRIKSEKAEYIIAKYEELKSTFGNNVDRIQSELRKWLKEMKRNNEIDLSGVSHYNYVDKRGVFYPGNASNTRADEYMFDIIHPKTGRVCKKPKKGYRWKETTFREAEKRGDIFWQPDETGIPRIKKRIETATELLKSYYYEDNRKSTQSLTELLGEKRFHNPKSLRLLEKLIKFGSGPFDLILDFFAGSGSIAHAVLNLNQRDGGNRRFILIEKENFVENVIIPRIQQVLQDEKIHSAKLKLNNQGQPVPYRLDDNRITDLFYK